MMSLFRYHFETKPVILHGVAGWHYGALMDSMVRVANTAGGGFAQHAGATGRPVPVRV